MLLCRNHGTELLTMGSMSFIENELCGVRPDILLAGAGSSRSEIHKYAQRLLTATGSPRVAIPTHWMTSMSPMKTKRRRHWPERKRRSPSLRKSHTFSPIKAPLRSRPQLQAASLSARTMHVWRAHPARSDGERCWF